MADKTLTRMDLNEAVFREVGLSRNESADLVESARVGRNPKTGDEAPIAPRRVLTFRPSHLLKDRVATGNS